MPKINRLSDAKKRGSSRPKTHHKKNKNNPCWNNYKQIGMKKKGGRMVPSCVPK